MAIKLNSKSFLSSSSSNPWAPQKSYRTSFSCRDVANLGHLLSNWGNSRMRWPMRFVLLENGTYVLHCRLVGFRKQCFTFLKSRRIGHFVPLVSAYDGGSVDGSPQASTSTNFEEMRVKHNQSLQGEDYSDELVQSLHDAARNIELSITEQSPSKISWFPTSWIGIDKTSWVKTLSYQASVYSLLQAASEISARGDRRDSAVNVFVHRSLLSNSAALESVIRDKLSANQPETYEWFWSKQIPSVITSFSNYIEGDLRLTASSSVSGKGNANDISLLMFALTCLASITKLGPTHVSCLELFSVRPDTTDRLMDMLIDFIPIHEAYHSIKSIGLRREFLIHFGSRAAACGLKNDQAVEEVVFWVDVIQNQLQEAIDRERIWARLTTSESIEVSNKDFPQCNFRNNF